MPIVNTFRDTCPHGSKDPDATPVRDWRECYQCIDEVCMELAIARAYLLELADGKFNDNGDMTVPVAEPLQGRHFQQIANTGFSQAGGVRDKR